MIKYCTVCGQEEVGLLEHMVDRANMTHLLRFRVHNNLATIAVPDEVFSNDVHQEVRRAIHESCVKYCCPKARDFAMEKPIDIPLMQKICPSCAAPQKTHSNKCDYCGSIFIPKVGE